MARYALVIGIAKYDNFTNLPKAVKDAEKIGQLLSQHGRFDVHPLPKKLIESGNSWEVTPDKKLIGKELGQELRTFLLDKAKGAEALIYFAGHGFEASSLTGEPKGYLATSDCNKDGQNAISFDDFNALISKSQLSSLVVILDCCYAGSLLERSLFQSSFSIFNSKQDYCLITASRSFERARENTEGGIFTEAVLKGLAPNQADAATGEINANDLISFVQRQLKDSGQEPIYIGGGRTITLVQYLPDKTGLAQTTPTNSKKLFSFVSSEVFFRPLLKPELPSNHLITLIGRTKFIQELNDFIDSKERVLIFTGRGGIGKTKILHAFSQEFKQRHQNFKLRFLIEGTLINNETLDELPTKQCLVILDDAHRREDLSTLFAFAQQNSQIKLILSSRPQGVDYLKPLLTRAHFNPSEVMVLSEIKELTYEEVKELAGEALGQEYAHYAHKLADITKDCPLITVVAGRLLAERKVGPPLLERDQEFRDFVLTKFQDELVGEKIIDELNPEHFKSLLRLISAVAPFNTENSLLKKASAEFIGIEEFILIEYIGILEDKGIVIRRGSSLRITPDVLADHILHKACITDRGIPTGYAQKTFENFQSICLTEVLQNLAELDWRIRQAEGKETDLLADIWEYIRLEFQKASNYDRGKLLDNFNNVAYYQPGKTLELVEFAMRNPATIQENEQLADFYNDSWVRYKLPDLLQKISYTIDYLPRCCDLLWELGRNDNRDLNPNAQHAIRVLKDLAEYEPEKPIEFYQNLVKSVSRWLKASDVHNHLYSPLDILEPLLKKSGETTYVEVNRIVSRPFVVNRPGVQIIRDNVLNVVEDCAKNHPLKSAIKAINILETALRNPEPYFKIEITAA
ncbi:caspase family protein [Anabaena sp. WFMT]|uniref:caspase family protein n=1 Tax=Anabaena sp. WFMT TaxID=3449730 RepID=UPI003F256EF3